MKTPIKLDIEPGAEWLLPAAKRWLEQAKRVMRTPLGAKVFDLPSGERVIVQWRQGLDSIRISGGAVWVCGRMTVVAPTYVLFKQLGGEITTLDQPLGAKNGWVNYISSDGVRACGHYQMESGRVRSLYWEDGQPTAQIDPPQLGTSAPANASIPGLFSTYINARFSRATPGVNTILGEVSITAALWPRLFLWSTSGVFTDLGFIPDFDSPLIAYPDTTPSNWVTPVAVSSSGSRVFGNHNLENWSLGGFVERVGAYWQADTGWVRIPPPPGFVAKSPGVPDAFTNRVTILAASQDGNTAVGLMRSVPPATETFPVIWQDGLGSRLIDTPALADLGPVEDMNVSSSGEFVLITPSTPGKQAVVWSAAGGGVPVPLAVSRAVDNYGRVIGAVGGAGVYAASFYGGEIVEYATAPTDTSSEILAASASGVVGSSGNAGALWRHVRKLEVTTPAEGFTSAQLSAVSGARISVKSGTYTYG